MIPRRRPQANIARACRHSLGDLGRPDLGDLGRPDLRLNKVFGRDAVGINLRADDIC